MIPGLATAVSTPRHDLVVLLDILLHGVIGYLLVQAFTDYSPAYGFLGGLIPNLDLAFDVWPRLPPLFVHRGLLHTPLFALGLLLALALVGVRERVVWPIGIGYLAELALDTVEGRDGVMWTYPVSTHHYALPVPGMAYWIPGLLIVSILTVLILHAAAAQQPAT